MSWKSIVITGLLCVLASPVLAAPTVNVTSSYNATTDNIEFILTVHQDTTNSLAIEAPLTLVPDTTGFAVGLRGNSSTSETTNSAGDNNGTAAQTWYYNVDTNGTTKLWNSQNDMANLTQNNGNNPFSASITDGLWLDTAGNRLFAALGSDVNMPSPVKTLHIASNDGVLNWTDLLVAENGALQSTLTGKYSSILKGDMNGNGSVNFGDLAGFGLWLTNQAGYNAANPGLDGAARADMNNNGAGNFGDLAGFGSCLTSPATCPVREQMGVTPGAGSGSIGGGAVPEPASAVLVLMGLLGLAPCVARNRN